MLFLRAIFVIVLPLIAVNTKKTMVANVKFTTTILTCSSTQISSENSAVSSPLMSTCVISSLGCAVACWHSSGCTMAILTKPYRRCHLYSQQTLENNPDIFYADVCTFANQKEQSGEELESFLVPEWNNPCPNFNSTEETSELDSGVCFSTEKKADSMHEDTRTPEEDTTTPEEDTTTPEEDTTTPEEDTTTPEKETTTPEKETTTPEKETTTPFTTNNNNNLTTTPRPTTSQTSTQPNTSTPPPNTPQGPTPLTNQGPAPLWSQGPAPDTSENLAPSLFQTQQNKAK